MTVQVLFIGDSQHPELSRVCAQLRVCVANYREVATIERALGELDTDWLPDGIVLGQLWPEQFAPADLERLYRRAPLARVVCCQGSWCRGRRRRSWIADGVHAIVAASGIGLWWIEELGEIANQSTGLLARPVTSGPEEQLDQILTAECRVWSGEWVAGVERSEPPVFPQSGGSLRSAPATSPHCMGVWSEDAEFAAVLAQMCRMVARQVVVSQPSEISSEDLECLVWDSSPWSQQKVEALKQYSRSHPATAVVAITAFASPESCQALVDAGAAAVLAKPLTVTDLLWQMHRLSPARMSAAHDSSVRPSASG